MPKLIEPGQKNHLIQSMYFGRYESLTWLTIKEVIKEVISKYYITACAFQNTIIIDSLKLHIYLFYAIKSISINVTSECKEEIILLLFY